MKRLNRVVVFVPLVLSACSQVDLAPMPKCSDPGTISLFKGIVTESLAGGEKRAEDWLSDKVEITFPRATKLEENIQKYSCAANLTVRADNSVAQVEIHYSTQVDDSGTQIVEVEPFEETPALLAIIESIAVAPATAASATPPIATPVVAPPDRAFTPLKGEDQISLGRCRMGECAWARIISTKIESSEQGSLSVTASLLGGTSAQSDEDSPPTAEEADISWDDQPHEVVAHCSLQHPSLTAGDEHFDLPLNDQGVPGVMESAADLYFNLCHSNFDGYSFGIDKFGYAVPSDFD